MYSSHAPRLLKLCRKALLPGMMMLAVLLCGTPATATAISYTYDPVSHVARVVYEDGISKSLVFDNEGNIVSSSTQSMSALLPGMLALLLPGQGQASPQEQGLQSSLLQ